MQKTLALLNRVFWESLLDGSGTAPKVKELLLAGEKLQDVGPVFFELAHRPKASPTSDDSPYQRAELSVSLMYNLAAAKLLAGKSGFWRRLLDDALRARDPGAQGRAAAVAGVMSWDLLSPPPAAARDPAAEALEEERVAAGADLGRRLLQQQLQEQLEEEAGLDLVANAMAHMLDAQMAVKSMEEAQGLLAEAQAALDSREGLLASAREASARQRGSLEDSLERRRRGEEGWEQAWTASWQRVGQRVGMMQAEREVSSCELQVRRTRQVLGEREAAVQAAINEVVVPLARANVLVFGSSSLQAA